jgi:hypothetical protein
MRHGTRMLDDQSDGLPRKPQRSPLKSPMTPRSGSPRVNAAFSGSVTALQAELVCARRESTRLSSRLSGRTPLRSCEGSEMVVMGKGEQEGSGREHLDEACPSRGIVQVDECRAGRDALHAAARHGHRAVTKCRRPAAALPVQHALPTVVAPRRRQAASRLHCMHGVAALSERPSWRPYVRGRCSAPLGGALARPLSLRRARLTVKGDSSLRGRGWAPRHCMPRVIELSASQVTDSTAHL